MNASLYLSSFGWEEGEALQRGGIKKPILVKHKKDTKGLGSDGNDADVWWERLFDGQLKNFEVSNGLNGVIFELKQRRVDDHVRKATSPLYRMFVRGEGLAGTEGKTDNAYVVYKSVSASVVVNTAQQAMRGRGKGTEKREKEGKEKKEKTDKKEKKEKKAKKKDKEEKEKKDIKETKEKNEKIDSKEKKEKKDMKESKHTKALKVTKEKQELLSSDQSGKSSTSKKSTKSAKSSSDKKRKREEKAEKPRKRRS
ncbi:hypothetical protein METBISCDRAFT_20982 [Metschnikowia bicuspidata]|uniref:G-patch domain-containing protein n=1 Tax=Metschnikowia bicuspidata TaxID=27322 RepID=A0A4P9ZJL5_9ASCO|nr:hypothetical protein METBISCDRAFT_20982 [Metschnikowia bicuspidata]